MTKARRRPLFGAALPYDRLAAIALILAATLPAALLGILVHDQVERSLSADAVARTDRAAEAATTEAGRAWGELDDLVGSDAGWIAFVSQVEGGGLESVRTGVLEFLVEQGAVDGGLVRSPDGTVVAGGPALTRALADQVGRFVVNPRFLSVDGEVVLVDDDPITGAGSTEPAAGALPLLIVVLVVLTGLDATLLATVPSTILRRRLGVVRDGLIAVADGRVPPTAPADSGEPSPALPRAWGVSS